MITRSHLLRLAAITAAAACLGGPAFAQGTIKIGELNSYKVSARLPRSLQEGLGAGGRGDQCRGRRARPKIEVISRDDGANPGDAVRVAEELVTREGVNIIAGTFLSHVGLAVTEFAGRKRCSSSPPSR